jgi:histidine triad (HIT) family protein
MNDDCVFCRILKGEAPGTLVRITDNWFTLVPKGKVSKGHILVIPSFHCEDITDLNNLDAIKELGLVLQKVSKNQMEGNNAQGINILNANKEAAQQSIFHLHFHIIPRYLNDNLDLWIRERL